MARETYSTLKAKIEKEINKLQKRAEILQTKRRKPVIASIVNSMREYDITPEEIIAAYNNNSGTKSRPSSSINRPAKKPVAPKYRHPQTGETWTGRGKPPRWLTTAETAGASRDSFLIKT